MVFVAAARYQYSNVQNSYIFIRLSDFRPSVKMARSILFRIRAKALPQSKQSVYEFLHGLEQGYKLRSF